MLRPGQSRYRHQKCGSGQRRIRLGGRPPSPDPPFALGDLRDACQGLYGSFQCRDLGRAPGDIFGGGTEDPLSAIPRGNGRGTDAGLCLRSAGCSFRLGKLLGLFPHQFLRSALGLRDYGRPAADGARISGHGQGFPPRRDGGDPGRGLQPYRRIGQGRPLAQFQRAGGFGVLHHDGRPECFCRLYRLRQYGQYQRSDPASGVARIAPLLGGQHACGRFPFRPGSHPHPGPRGKCAGRFACARLDRSGSGALRYQTHRRSVGCGRPVPTGIFRRPGTGQPLGGVERGVSRRYSPFCARRRRNGPPLGSADHRFARYLRRCHARHQPEHPFRELPRRFYPERSGHVPHQAQSGQRRRQPRRTERKLQRQLRSRRTQRRPGGGSASRASGAELFCPASLYARHAHDRHGGRGSPHPAG